MQDFEVHKQREEARREALQARISRAEDREPSPAATQAPVAPPTETRLRTIFRSAPIGIGLAADRVLLDVNDRLCEMVGYSADELIGRNARMLYVNDEDYAFVGEEAQRQTAEFGTGTVESRWRRQDGAVIDVLLSSTPLDPDDLSQGATFTALDITARKKAEDELQSIFDMSVDMVCIADIHTTQFLKVNPAFERTLGYREDELVGTSFLALLHPDDRAATEAIVQSRLRKGESILNFENRYLCKDGSYRWFNWMSQPKPERGLTYAIARDITARKEANEILKHSEEKYRTLMEGAPVSMLVVRGGRCVHANAYGAAQFGCSRPAELVGRDVFEMIDPAFRAQVRERVAKATCGQHNEPIEIKIIGQDGVARWIESTSQPITLEGAPATLVIGHDITGRKHAKDALQRERTFLRQIIDAVPGFVCVKTEEGRFALANQALADAYGVTVAEVEGKSDLDFSPAPEEAAAFRRDDQEVMRSRRAKVIGEEKITYADGSTHWLATTKLPLTQTDGSRVQLLAVATDVTERHEAREALQASEEKYRAVFESDSQGFFLMTDVFLECNAQACRLWGCCRADIIGHSPLEFSPAVQPDGRESETAARAYLDAALAGTPQRFYWQHRRKDGTLIDCEIALDALRQGDRPILLAALTDITERKRTEAERERLTAIIEATSDLVSVATVDGRISYMNRAGLRVLGLPEDTEVRQITIQSVHPDWAYRLIAEEGIPAAIEHGTWQGETVVLRPDGQETPVSQVIMAHKSKDGTVEYLSTIMRDLTERKAAETALRESETRFRELAEMLPQTVFEIDAGGTFTFGNRAGREMFGYSSEELSGLNVAQLFVPEDRERMTRNIQRRLTNQMADNRQYQALRRDGSTFPMLVYASPIIRDGRAIGLRGIGLDITERQRAERAIQESKAKLESILESSPNAITVIDLAGDIVDCNQATVVMHGQEASYELLGRSLFDLVAERDRSLARMHLERTRSQGPTQNVELTLLKRDGREFPAEVSISVMSDRHENAMGFVVATADISERKKAREALRRSEEKYRSLIANIPDVVWTGDEHGNTSFMSPNIESVCGYRPEDICGRPGEPWFEKIHPDDRAKVRQAEASLFQEGLPLNVEYRLKRKDGAWIWLQDRSTGTYEKDGVRHADGVFIDITERKEAEEALAQSTHLLRESQKVAQLGHYSFDIRANLWTSSNILDAIFGIPETFAKTAGGWLEVVHPEQREEMQAYLGEVISGARPGFDQEYRIVRLSDRQVRWVHGLGRIEHDEAGNATHMIGTIQDVTERRAAEQALQESERRLSTLMANLPGMAYRCRDDENWTMEFVSEGCTELTGYATTDVVGSRRISYGSIIHPDDRQRVHDEVGLALQADGAFEIEYRIVTAPGQEKWVWERGRRVGQVDGGIGILEGFVLDISERRKAEEGLRAYQRKLKSLASELALAEERERRRIAADLHDHACQNLVLSNMKLQQLRASAPQAHLEAIEAIAQTLHTTIESVRDLTFDLSSPTLYKFGLSAALEELLEDKLAGEYDIQCRFRDDGRPKPLSQDVLVLLFQSVRELLINIIKHAEAHEVMLDIRREQDSIRIVLTDDGIGFDVNEVLSLPSQHRSVGLFNILERLDYIGGTLDIKSQPGRGSRFELVASLTTEPPGAKESEDGSANSSG